MSEGNAEMVREVFGLLSRGEVDSVLDRFAASGFEVDWSRSLSGMNGVYTDRESLAADWRSVWVDPWEWIEITVTDAEEVGADRVLCQTHVRMRGKGSGAEVEATAGSVWTFANGKVVRSVLFQTAEEARVSLEA